MSQRFQTHQVPSKVTLIYLQPFLSASPFRKITQGSKLLILPQNITEGLL